ncbi:MAG: hypothetical protein ACK4S4_14310 [Pyrinomonadaceae bacterium]
MKNVRNFLAATVLSSILLVGSTFAGDGIIVAGLTDDASGNACTVNEKVDNGIIVAGATGIIVAGFTGIIVAGFTGIIVAGAADSDTDCTKVDNGILISD